MLKRCFKKASKQQQTKENDEDLFKEVHLEQGENQKANSYEAGWTQELQDDFQANWLLNIICTKTVFED
jgi:hypothetical protein